MAKKLVIQIEAKDQITSPVRKMVQGVLGFGTSVLRVDKMVVGAVRKMVRSLFSLQGAIGALVGAVAIMRLARSFNQATVELDRMAKTARQFNLPVEQFAALEFAAERSGIATNNLVTAYRNLQIRVSQFATGDAGQARKSIERLEQAGVNFAQRGLPLFKSVMDAVAGIADETERTRITADLFGSRSGPQLLRLIKDGKSDLADLVREAERFGTITQAQTAAAEAVRDAVSNMSRAWLFFRANVIASVGPAVTDLINQLADATKRMGDLTAEIARGIALALGEGPLAGEARKIITAMVQTIFDGAIRLVHVGATEVVRTFVVVLTTSIPALAIVGRRIGNSLAMSVIEGVGNLWIMFWEGLAVAGSQFAQDMADSVRDGMSSLRDEFAPEVRNVHEELNQLFETARPQLVESFGHSWAALSRTMAESGRDFDILATRLREQIGLLAQLRDESGTTADSTRQKWSEWAAEWRGGVIEGMREFEKRVNKAADIGKQFAITLSDQISTGVTTAIWDAIEGVKSLKEAFKDFARTTLRLIGEMITKALIARALGVVLGSIGGGAATASPFGVQGPPAGMHGGIVEPGAIRRFAGGGMVPGPNVNRDIVQAILAPGEYVTNKRAVDRIGAGAMQYMNRTGQLPQSAAPVINLHLEIHGNATPETVAALQRAVGSIGDRLRQELSQRPQLRDDIRGHLNP